MTTLKAKLRTDLTTAMKAKDELRKDTLRMLLAAITNAEVSGAQARELADDEVLKVLGKEAKKRAESAAVYTGAGRAELAEREQAEAKIIDEYLPKQLSDSEVADLAAKAVEQVAAELGAAPSMRQMGQVMKVASALAGGRADGSRISQAVKTRL